MNAINNPYAVTPPTDTTLTKEGVAADAKVVGDALNRKLSVGTNVGYSAESNSCDIDLSSLENGEYLLLAPRSSKISAILVETNGCSYYDSSITGTGKNLKWAVNQWYTSVYAIKIN